MTETAYIGLGSNLGDREAYLKAGLSELSAHPEVQIKKVSSIYETTPIGYTRQPLFLNAVAALETTIPAPSLLLKMQDIEAHHQRQRTIHWGPRTLDLDLLLYGSKQIDSPDLMLPHPHLTERCFVLAPLCEIAPTLRHPGTDRSLQSHYQSLDCARQLRRIHTSQPVLHSRSSCT